MIFYAILDISYQSTRKNQPKLSICYTNCASNETRKNLDEDHKNFDLKCSIFINGF